MAKKRRLTKSRLLVGTVLLLLLFFGALIGRRLMMPEPPAPPTAQVAPPSMREVILYFADPEQLQLVAESREIAGCSDETACLAATIQALSAGPSGSLVPILPATAALRGATVENETAVLDFSRDFIAAHPGGSQSELFTVYGLADTVAVNFSHLRQVKILVEGRAVATIKGHIDLREPVLADFRYTRPPEGLTQPQEDSAPPAEGRIGQ